MYQEKQGLTLSWPRANDTCFGLETTFLLFLYKHVQACTEIWGANAAGFAEGKVPLAATEGGQWAVEHSDG